MTSIDPERLGRYNSALHEESERLDGALAEIRTNEDARRLTVREAADARIAVLESHLTRLRLLKAEYLNDH